MWDAGCTTGTAAMGRHVCEQRLDSFPAAILITIQLNGDHQPALAPCLDHTSAWMQAGDSEGKPQHSGHL